MRRIFTLVNLAFMSWLNTGAAWAETELKLHHWLPPQAMVARDIIVPWTERVMSSSQGAIKVKVFPSLQLGGAPQQLPDQAKNGVVDFALGLPSYTPGRFPRLEVFELPTVFNGDPLSTGLAIANMTSGPLAKDFTGVIPVMQGVHAGNVMHCKDKAIRTLDDFKGLKIRTPNRTGSYMLEELGAIPVGMPVTQVAESLSKGVIDCAALPWEIAGTFKIHELTKFHTSLDKDGRFGTAVIFVLMNKNVYEKLPKKGKAAIDANIGEASAKAAAQSWIAGELPARKAAKARGNEVIELSATDTKIFLKKMKQVEKRWSKAVAATGVDGPALISAAKKTISGKESGN